MAHYIHDDKNNRIEGMSKEEIYALIDEVIESGELPTDVQTAFVTALKSIVDGKPYKIGLCTQAEYNELEAQGELVEDALYIITDDSSYDDLVALITAMQTAITNLTARVDALDLINVEIDSESPNLSQDLSSIITHGAIISAGIQATLKSSSTVYYYSSIIHIDDLNHTVQSLAKQGDSATSANAIYLAYNSTTKKLACAVSAVTSPTPLYENPQFTSIKILAKW